jgi:hypothetical protein
MTSRLILSLLVAVCLTRAAQAGPQPRPTPPHHHTVIESVSADSITIVRAGVEKTYKITSATEIELKGETVTADKLEAGMRVSVTPDAVDDTVAGQITASDPPTDPQPNPTK